jgi:hypothetical protein
MKRLTVEEAKQYIPLQACDPHFAARAIAFTLTPSTDPGFSGFDEVTYYADAESFDFTVSPLEVMYDIWDREKKGDEELS